MKRVAHGEPTRTRAVGIQSGGSFCFVLGVRNRKHIKGLAELDVQALGAQGGVRYYEIEQSSFFAGGLRNEKLCNTLREF